MQSLQRENMKWQNYEAKENASSSAWNRVLTQATVLNALGIPYTAEAGSNHFPKLFIKCICFSFR